MRNHLLASEGYCVVSIDSRGSHNRGTAFEAHLRHRMGQVSLQIKSSGYASNKPRCSRLKIQLLCLIFVGGIS